MAKTTNKKMPLNLSTGFLKCLWESKSQERSEHRRHSLKKLSRKYGSKGYTITFLKKSSRCKTKEGTQENIDEREFF